MRTKLIVKNETDWRTDDIRKLFLECMKREGVTRCHVTVRDAQRGRNTHGYAWYNSSNIVMYFPVWFNKYLYEEERYIKEHHDELNSNEIVSIAKVFIHELDHNRGLRHEDMLPTYKIDCEWAKSYIIRKKMVKSKPKRDIVQERHQKAIKNVNLYQSKVKRYTNLLKKWEKKVAYYQKKEVLSSA